MIDVTLLGAGVSTAFAVILLGGTSRLRSQPWAITAIAVLGALSTAVAALSVHGTAAWPVAAVAAIALMSILVLPRIEPAFDDQRVEVGALLLLASAGGIALATSSNLVTLLIALETLSLAVAVLTGLSRGQKAVEAAFKYFMLSCVSIATMAYGLALYALATGSFEIGAAMPADPAAQRLLQVGSVLIVLGLAYELALVPFHYAVLGAYTVAAPAIAGFLMALSKLGAVIVLARIAGSGEGPVGSVLILIGVASIVWGTLGALAQRGLRGMLGYSAVANGGFLALALGSGERGQHAAILYVLVYGATTLLTFTAISHLGEDEIDFDQLAKKPLGRARTLALTAGLLSFSGMPPTPGFWAKLAVLGASFQHAGWVAMTIAILGAVLGALYYLRPVPDLIAALRGATERTEAGTKLSLLGAAAALAVFAVAPFLAYRLTL
jgi:NADH-quinone oxidoreductase subunit N